MIAVRSESRRGSVRAKEKRQGKARNDYSVSIEKRERKVTAHFLVRCATVCGLQSSQPSAACRFELVQHRGPSNGQKTKSRKMRRRNRDASPVHSPLSDVCLSLPASQNKHLCSTPDPVARYQNSYHLCACKPSSSWTSHSVSKCAVQCFVGTCRQDRRPSEREVKRLTALRRLHPKYRRPAHSVQPNQRPRRLTLRFALTEPFLVSIQPITESYPGLACGPVDLSCMDSLPVPFS